jgi:hypothetical protein
VAALQLRLQPVPLVRAARRDVPQLRTAMKKVRIVRLGLGTARQETVLERWTNPKPLQAIWDRAAI